MSLDINMETKINFLEAEDVLMDGERKPTLNESLVSRRQILRMGEVVKFE